VTKLSSASWAWANSVESMFEFWDICEQECRWCNDELSYVKMLEFWWWRRNMISINHNCRSQLQHFVTCNIRINYRLWFRTGVGLLSHDIIQSREMRFRQLTFDEFCWILWLFSFLLYSLPIRMPPLVMFPTKPGERELWLTCTTCNNNLF